MLQRVAEKFGHGLCRFAFDSWISLFQSDFSDFLENVEAQKF